MEFFMLFLHACQPSAAFTINREIILPITVAERGLRHEKSSSAQTLGSWARIPLKAWMFV
jgi:hypothetical protein